LPRFINILFEIFKLSATPPSIVYPIPLLAFLLFSLSSCRDPFCLLCAIAFTFTSQAGINLWNHVNDVEEDILAGKRNVFTENPGVRRAGAIIAIMLYCISFIILYIFSKDKLISTFAFIVVCFVTWVYSDRFIFGRFFRRWKDYYVTEVLTYVISAPLYVVAVWSFFSSVGIRTFAVAAFMTPFTLSGTFLKDIKDVTGDEMAGLKTLAVLFSPSSLLRISVALLWVYYFEIFIFVIFDIIPVQSILVLVALLGLIYSSYYFINLKWKISVEIVKFVKIMIYSNILSLLLIALGCLIFPL